MISLVLCTYRPGSFDLFVDSFIGVEGDYELVVVDDYPGRALRGSVPHFLRAAGVKLGWYGVSKPKCYPQTKGGLCNAMNTALCHVRGDYVVFVCDYTILPRYWLTQWEIIQKSHPNHMISGGGIVYHAPKPTVREDIRTWEDIPALAPKWPWVAKEFETFYWGCPLKHFLSTNGEDERADHCHCWPVYSKVAQARMLGIPFGVMPDIACHVVDHRVWDTPEEPNPVGAEGLWRITHAQSIPQEPCWEVPCPNPGFDLKEERRKNGL